MLKKIAKRTQKGVKLIYSESFFSKIMSSGFDNSAEEKQYFSDDNLCAFPGTGNEVCEECVILKDNAWRLTIKTVRSSLNVALLWQALVFDELDSRNRHYPKLVDVPTSDEVAGLCKNCKSCLTNLFKGLNVLQNKETGSVLREVISQEVVDKAILNKNQRESLNIYIRNSHLEILNHSEDLVKNLPNGAEMDGKILVTRKNNEIFIYLQFFPKENPEHILHKSFLKNTDFQEMSRYDLKQNCGGCHIRTKKFFEDTFSFELYSKSGDFGALKYQKKIIPKIEEQLRKKFGVQTHLKKGKLCIY